METLEIIPDKYKQLQERYTTQLELIEFKEEPECNKDEVEPEHILPDLVEEDPLRIDDKGCDEDSLSTNQKFTGFILWSADRRKELLESNPQMTSSQISEQLCKEWDEVPFFLQKKYRVRALSLNLEPIRQSRRPKKPKEIEDLSYFEKNNKKTGPRKIPQRRSRKVSCLNNIQSETPDSVMKEKMFEVKKTKTRYTAYTLWAQEARIILLKDRPEMTFVEISKQLSEMWKNVTKLEKYNYRRRAKRLTEKMLNVQPNIETKIEKKDEEIPRVSSKGRVISLPTKLTTYNDEIDDILPSRKKSKSSVMIAQPEVDDDIKLNDEEAINNSSTEYKREMSPKSKSQRENTLNHDSNSDSPIEVDHRRNDYIPDSI